MNEILRVRERDRDRNREREGEIILLDVYLNSLGFHAHISRVPHSALLCHHSHSHTQGLGIISGVPTSYSNCSHLVFNHPLLYFQFL